MPAQRQWMPCPWHNATPRHTTLASRRDLTCAVTATAPQARGSESAAGAAGGGARPAPAAVEGIGTVTKYPSSPCTDGCCVSGGTG